MMRKYEGREPADVFGQTMTVDFKFDENKAYVRKVLDQQIDIRQLPDGTWATKQDLPDEWPSYPYQQQVNADGIPSQELLDVQQARGPRPGDDLLARRREAALSLRER